MISWVDSLFFKRQHRASSHAVTFRDKTYMTDGAVGRLCESPNVVAVSGTQVRDRNVHRPGLLRLVSLSNQWVVLKMTLWVGPQPENDYAISHLYMG